jgi:uncharacterized iron-regulated membrane protein
MKKRDLILLHRKVGIVFAPFLILTSLTGVILLFRKDGLYSKEVKNILIGLHNWELGAKYVGIILALGLIFLSVSGLILAFRKKW